MAEPNDLLTWQCPALCQLADLSDNYTLGPREYTWLSAIWKLPSEYVPPDNWNLLSGEGGPRPPGYAAHQPSDVIYNTSWNNLNTVDPVSAVRAFELNEVYESITSFEKTALVSGFQWDPLSATFPLSARLEVKTNETLELQLAIDDLSGKLICFADYATNNIIVDASCPTDNVTQNASYFDGAPSSPVEMVCGACNGEFGGACPSDYSGVDQITGTFTCTPTYTYVGCSTYTP